MHSCVSNFFSCLFAYFDHSVQFKFQLVFSIAVTKWKILNWSDIIKLLKEAYMREFSCVMESQKELYAHYTMCNADFKIVHGGKSEHKEPS